MKKKVLIITTGLLIIALSSFAIYANSSSPNTHTKYKVVSGSFDKDKEHFDRMNIKLEKTTEPAKISPDIAVESAKGTYKDLGESAKEISVEYVAMTNGYEAFSEEALEKNPKLKKDKSLKSLPVYIVSFKGLELLPPSGGRAPERGIKTKDVQFKTESNVVVDAETGETLFAFTYK